MPTMFFEKRTPILFLHWSIVLLTVSVLYLGDPVAGFTVNDWAILLTIVVQAALWIPRRAHLDDRFLAFVLVLSDTGGACLAGWLSSAPGSVFYGLLFVCLLVAATVRSGKLLIALSAVLAGAYVVILALEGLPLGQVHWLTALLLADCGLFFGYLAQLQRALEVKAGAIYTEDLLEFGKALSRAGDLERLLTEIPRLVPRLMGVDNCELALIEDERIVRRILLNRHCRDYVDLEITQSVHERAVLNPGVVYASTEMQESPEFNSKKDFPLYPYRTYMGKAWAVKDKAIGLMALFTEEKCTWTEYSKQQFQFLVDYFFLALHNAKLRSDLEALARNDGLTGLDNHRYFCERLEIEFEKTRRKNHPLSIALIDLDHFKKLNDSAGHRVGDQVLQALSLLLRSNIRRTDLAGRLGGDEFAVAFPETTSEDALMLCRRVLEAVAKLKVGQRTGFSLSIGCATYPADGDTLAEIIERADRALYYSKNLGRGRVSRYSDIAAQQKTH